LHIETFHEVLAWPFKLPFLGDGLPHASVGILGNEPASTVVDNGVDDRSCHASLVFLACDEIFVLAVGDQGAEMNIALMDVC
jgi:hypothetical protein